MSKWNAVRSSFARIHDDLFDAEYTAEFFNISQGTRDNLTDTYSGETRASLGSTNVEIVPPAMDTTVDTEGTSFSWDTSIRFPLSTGKSDGWGVDSWGENWGSVRLAEVLIPLGEDNRKPTEVEITDDAEETTDVFELQGYSYEKGSGMVMCRLVEQ